MSAAALALKSAIHSVLTNDAGLTALVPAARILDRTPQGQAMPFILHGPIRSEDFSTATERGGEHFFTLEVWTEAGGQVQALAIAARLQALLDDTGLVLPGFRLVSLFHRTTRTRRDPRARAVIAELQFRAVTEG